MYYVYAIYIYAPVLMETFDLASVGIRFSLMCSSNRIRPLTDKKGFLVVRSREFFIA